MSDWELVHVRYAECYGRFEEIEWRVETWVDWYTLVTEEDWIIIYYCIRRGVIYGGA